MSKFKSKNVIFYPSSSGVFSIAGLSSTNQLTPYYSLTDVYEYVDSGCHVIALNNKPIILSKIERDPSDEFLLFLNNDKYRYEIPADCPFSNTPEAAFFYIYKIKTNNEWRPIMHAGIVGAMAFYLGHYDYIDTIDHVASKELVAFFNSSGYYQKELNCLESAIVHSLNNNKYSCPELIKKAYNFISPAAREYASEYALSPVEEIFSVSTLWNAAMLWVRKYEVEHE